VDGSFWEKLFVRYIMVGMTQERYNAIFLYLRTGRAVVDLETGNVKFPFSRNQKMTRKTDKHGYLVANMQFPDGTYKPVKLHQIVAVAGGMNPVGMTIDHVNGNKLDNRLCNLRVVSSTENIKLAWHEQHLMPVENRARNETSGRTKLKNVDVAHIKYLLQNGASVVKLAKEYGVAHSRISDIKNGKTWCDIQAEPYFGQISLFA
jgi:hypothetical protein